MRLDSLYKTTELQNQDSNPESKAYASVIMCSHGPGSRSSGEELLITAQSSSAGNRRESCSGRLGRQEDWVKGSWKESYRKCGQNKQGYRVSQNRGKEGTVHGGSNMDKTKQQMCLLIFHYCASVKKCGHVSGQRLCRSLEKS